MVEPNGLTEIINECIEIMTVYRNRMKSKDRSGGLEPARQMIHRLAEGVARLGLRSEDKARMILRPVEAGLGRRFGPRIARSLFAEFVSAFWIPSGALHAPLDMIGSKSASRPGPAPLPSRPVVGPR